MGTVDKGTNGGGGGTLRSPFSWCHSLCPRVCPGSSTRRAPLSPLSDVPSRAGTGPHSQTQLKEAQTLPEPDGGVADTLLNEHVSFSASSFCSQAFFPRPRPSDSSPPVCFPPPPPPCPMPGSLGPGSFCRAGLHYRTFCEDRDVLRLHCPVC